MLQLSHSSEDLSDNIGLVDAWARGICRDPYPSVNLGRCIEEEVRAKLFGPPEPTEPNTLEATYSAECVMISQYSLLEPVLMGAGEVVYIAYDRCLDRKVALRLALPMDGKDFCRSVRELTVAANVAHPNVARIYDIGKVDGKICIVQELGKGMPLHRWLQAKPRKWPEVLRVLVDVARGLSVLHASHVVLRTFSKCDVMVEEGGMTTISVPSGGGVYTSPEQLEGCESGPAGDQFAWSVMAWGLLYGELPFAAESPAAAAAAVMESDKRPEPRGNTVPDWLREVLEKGLARSPSRRWSSMAELLSALDRASRVARARRAARLLFCAVVLAALAASYAFHNSATP